MKLKEIPTFYELMLNDNKQKLLTVNDSIRGKGQSGSFRYVLLISGILLLFLTYLVLRFPHFMNLKVVGS